MLAFALARVGRHAEAFAALEAGLARNYSVEALLEHDGRGRLGFVTLPFVLMRERGNLDIGVVEGPLIRD